LTPRLISNLLFHRSAATRTALSPEELKYLVDWVVRSDQPFTVVEDPQVLSLLRWLKPDIVVPYANIIKNAVMKTYEEMRVCIGDRMCNAGSKISLTLDCWTSPNGKAFLGITVHCIDDGWVPQSLVLNFIPLHNTHTGKMLSKAFFATCERFDILTDILGITTDCHIACTLRCRCLIYAVI
jgi:hypothetical protein